MDDVPEELLFSIFSRLPSQQVYVKDCMPQIILPSLCQCIQSRELNSFCSPGIGIWHDELVSSCRRVALPLVCKTWREILSQPSSLWHDLTVDLNDQSPPLRSPAQLYFKRRRDYLKSLHLFLPAGQAAFAADILEALGNEPPLKRFNVNFGGANLAYIPTFLPQVAWLRQLRALRIAGLQVSFCRSLEDTLSCITCLGFDTNCHP